MFSGEEASSIQADPDDNPQDFQLQFSILQFSICEDPNDWPD